MGGGTHLLLALNQLAVDQNAVDAGPVQRKCVPFSFIYVRTNPKESLGM